MGIGTRIDEKYSSLLDGEVYEEDAVVDKHFKWESMKLKDIEARFVTKGADALGLKELLLLKRKRSGKKKITLEIDNVGWYSGLKRRDVYEQMNNHTLALLMRMSINTSFGGRLMFSNGKYISSVGQLREFFGISKSMWFRNIRNDFIKHKIIVKETIDGKTFLLTNPLFINPIRPIEEGTFIAFKDEIYKYLNELDYAILSRQVCGQVVKVSEL